MTRAQSGRYWTFCLHERDRFGRTSLFKLSRGRERQAGRGVATPGLRQSPGRPPGGRVIGHDSFQLWIPFVDFLDPVGVEQRRCRRTISQRKLLANCPRALVQICLKPVVGCAEPFARNAAVGRVSMLCRSMHRTRRPACSPLRGGRTRGRGSERGARALRPESSGWARDGAPANAR